MEEKILYNVIEVSKILGVGKNKVYELIEAKILPALKIGGLKIRRTALLKFVEDYEGYDLTDTNNIKKLDMIPAWHLRRIML